MGLCDRPNDGPSGGLNLSSGGADELNMMVALSSSSPTMPRFLRQEARRLDVVPILAPIAVPDDVVDVVGNSLA